MEVTTYAGYSIVRTETELSVQGYDREIKAPCGCYACDDGVQPGHFACSQPPADLLESERVGHVVRSYTGGSWRWFVV